MKKYLLTLFICFVVFNSCASYKSFDDCESIPVENINVGTEDWTGSNTGIF